MWDSRNGSDPKRIKNDTPSWGYNSIRNIKDKKTSTQNVLRQNMPEVRAFSKPPPAWPRLRPRWPTALAARASEADRHTEFHLLAVRHRSRQYIFKSYEKSIKVANSCEK